MPRTDFYRWSLDVLVPADLLRGRPPEKRILHLLAQGGRIEISRDDDRKIERLQLITRED